MGATLGQPLSAAVSSRTQIVAREDGYAYVRMGVGVFLELADAVSRLSGSGERAFQRDAQHLSQQHANDATMADQQYLFALMLLQ